MPSSPLVALASRAASALRPLIVVLTLLQAAFPAPLSLAAGNPDAVGVVIGVSRYKHRDLPRVDYALNDALRVREFLIEALGYRPENIIYGENSTAGELYAIFGTEGDPAGKLRNWLRDDQSDVFVYWSGHGAPDFETREAYLVPADADPQRLRLTAYPRDVLLGNLDELPARSLTVVLEACFSGTSHGGSVMGGISPGFIKAKPGSLRLGTLLASAQADQVSTWYQNAAQSLFTFYLLKGMYGAADRQEVDGKVTMAELRAYLEEEVPFRARRVAGREQTPQIATSEPERVVVKLNKGLRSRLEELDRLESVGAAAGPTTRPPGSQWSRPGESPTGTGVLYVDSEPQGAQVYVDAEPKGETPVEVPDVRSGDREVAIVAPGHVRLVKVVTVEAGSREILREKLAVQTGSLKVTTTPAGAQVRVNGKELGQSPAEAKALPVGEHEVKASHPDYQSGSQKVKVHYGEETELELRLEPRPGRLLVLTTPEGAEVSVDGSRVGKSPWSGEAAAGSHQVRVSLEGHASQIRSVELRPNGAETIDSTLQRGPQFLGGSAGGAKPLTAGELGFTWPEMGDVIGADGAPMVLVPAGEFVMGSTDADPQARDDEKPQHRVYLDAFYIDKFEVTNGQYRAFVKATRIVGHRFCSRDEPMGKDHDSTYRGDKEVNGVRQPVVGVDWYDAYAYCAWAGKRLTTEAEWEKAARGSNGRVYPWGNSFERHLANGGGRRDGFEKTAPVGSFRPGSSNYGALDMSGNVYEWVQDWYDDEYYKQSPARNPEGPESGQDRVLRGGSWSNAPESLRAAKRRMMSPHPQGIHHFGFRCAQDP